MTTNDLSLTPIMASCNKDKGPKLACWQFFPEVYKSDFSYVLSYLKLGFATIKRWTLTRHFSHAKQRHVKVEDGEIKVARWHFPGPFDITAGWLGLGVWQERKMEVYFGHCMGGK